MRGKTPRKRKCIITFSRAWNALAATRCLGRCGVEVITGDTSRLSAASFSRYSTEHFTYPNPDDDPEGFLEKLEEIIRKHRAPDTDLVLMPVHMDTYTIITNQERFSGLVKIALPSREQFELAGDKARLNSFCQTHNIRIPPTLAVERAGDFAAAANSFTYPAFLKLRSATASIGIQRVKSAKEAIFHFERMIQDYDLKPSEYPLLQESMEGEDYCSTFLFAHGEPRAAMTYRNILEYPKKSGMGALRETVDAPELEEIGNAVLKKMKWHGVAQIDFRWDGKSTPWLIEINPRFWGGLAQSIASGWDFPLWLYQLAVDGHVDPIKPVWRYVRTKNPCLTALLALQEFREAESKGLDHRKRFRAARKVFSADRTAVNELFHWDDPLPMLGLLYPLTVFMKHGKVTPELLIAKAKIQKKK